MNIRGKGGLMLGVAILLVVGVAIGMSLNSRTVAQGSGGNANARFTVVETDGLSLIVTDNQKNTVFFYTVDQGDKPGADLHLRGTVELSNVGQATIKPTLRASKK